MVPKYIMTYTLIHILLGHNGYINNNKLLYKINCFFEILSCIKPNKYNEKLITF